MFISLSLPPSLFPSLYLFLSFSLSASLSLPLSLYFFLSLSLPLCLALSFSFSCEATCLRAVPWRRSVWTLTGLFLRPPGRWR